MTPYMLACKRGHHKVIEILGNDPRVDPHWGRTFMTYPRVRSCIVKAKKFDPNRMYDDRSLLLRTCQHYHEDAEGVKILLRVGADPNLADKDGVTPLMSAARDGKAESMKLLLDNGADIHSVAKGHSALTLACAHQRFGCAALLLHEGANVHERYDDKCVLEVLKKSPFYRKKEWFRLRIRKLVRRLEKWHVALLPLPSDTLRCIAEFL